MSWLVATAGTGDDYTLTLNYAGLTTDCDVVLAFDDTRTGFAVCGVSGVSLSPTHIALTDANVFFNTNFEWFFNDTAQVPALRLWLLVTLVPLLALGGSLLGRRRAANDA